MEPEGERWGDRLQTEPQALGDGPGQHRDGPLRQVQVGRPSPGLQVQRAVRRDQRRDVGDVHPDAVPIQAEGIVGVPAVLVVDRVGGEPRQVDPGLIGQSGRLLDWRLER